MSTIRHAVQWILALPLAGAALAASVSSTDLARCASLTAPDARLACFDALAKPATAAAPHAGAAAVATAPAAGAAAAATPAPTAAELATAEKANFGLNPAQMHSVPSGPESVSAHVTSIATDRYNTAYVKLDNGQTWTFADSDGRLSTGDAVTIKKASLGSFLMLTPSKHNYRVKRLE